ncbi:restriction endonuclease [Streptomyces sp. NPDC004520]|uniref:restriction endonuclease n=1 Tax=Streptomyces sp. NPDC004520 TaxID=3364702 RepID=UPI00368372A2
MRQGPDGPPDRDPGAGPEGKVGDGTACTARLLPDPNSRVEEGALGTVTVRRAPPRLLPIPLCRLPSAPGRWTTWPSTPEGFEHTIAALCARDGCSPVEVVGGADDLGAGVIATTTDRRRVVLQYKQYGEEHRAGSPDLQRLGGTCYAVHEADVAILGTTSSFTEPALEYAASCGMVCVEGTEPATWTASTAPAPWAARVGEPVPGTGDGMILCLCPRAEHFLAALLTSLGSGVQSHPCRPPRPGPPRPLRQRLPRRPRGRPRPRLALVPATAPGPRPRPTRGDPRLRHRHRHRDPQARRLLPPSRPQRQPRHDRDHRPASRPHRQRRLRVLHRHRCLHG